jgi:hypothetical protein
VIAGAIVLIGAWTAYYDLVPEQRSQAPQLLDDFDAGCGSRRVAFTAAAAHAGPPPHPAVVMDVQNGSTQANLTNKLPKEMVPDNPPSVQLIACFALKGAGSGPAAGTCSYDAFPGVDVGPGLPVKLLAGTYDLTVYEARTGRQVASARIVGTACPESASIRLGGSQEDVVDGTLTIDQYVGALRGLVDG